MGDVPMTERPLTGKVCLITGASSGIGRETALGIARLGATTVLLCRDASKARAARDEIRARSGNAAISILLADLASQVSIRSAAAEFLHTYGVLHILINNAGVVLRHRVMTEDGYEMTFAVNHLAPFLLTNLLLPALRAGAPSRIITVSSQAERAGRIDFDDLHGVRRYRGVRAYAQSKLANVLFTYELAERLHGTGVTANCVHPGGVATGIVRDYPAWVQWLWRRHFVTPEVGARTSIYLASSPDVEGVTGCYFEPPNRVAKSSPRSYDVATRERLWALSAELTGLA